MLQDGKSRVRLPMGSLIFFSGAPNPSRSNVAPKFTQTVVEMSTGTFLEEKRGRRVRLTT
jgi:hypothetical protein